MVDVGDVAIQGSDTEGNYARITRAAWAIAERGSLMVAIGGDHSISYPLGRGLEPLGEFDVVHVDAHADFLDELNGSRLTGASQLRRLAELPFVGTVTALGLRNVDRVEVDGLRELGARWATTLDVLDRGATEVVRETVPEADALYVSIDLDVLDSSVAPGHSLQEPGGLSYRQLRAILLEVARRGRVIGFDVVELNPSRDPERRRVWPHGSSRTFSARSLIARARRVRRPAPAVHRRPRRGRRARCEG
jgi:agmatinase